MSVLVQRSVLGRSGYPLDEIHIRGIAARGFHGVLQSEREAGQDFSADVTLYLDTRAAARGDDLTETVNYALVAQDVHAILSGEPVNLVETVAERIADAVLARPQVISVDVTVHKPQAPIPLPFDDVVVTIHRDRVNVPVVSAPDDLETATTPDEPAAHVVDALTPDVADALTPHVADALTPHAPSALTPGAADEPAGRPADLPADVPAVAAPIPVQQVRPVVISRVATDELAQVPARRAATAPAQDSAPSEQPTASPEEAAATHPEPGAVDVPDGMPPVPGPDETLLIPRHVVEPEPEPVLPPTPDETARLEEQARASAALRRPEVFGVTRISAGDRPDVLLDESASTTSFAQVPADVEPEAEPAPERRPEVVEDEPYGVPDAPSALETTTVLDPVQLLDRMDARPTTPVDVVVALGANLGDAQETLRQAVTELAAVDSVEVVAVGPLARTAAVGGPDQPDFLNTVVLARTTSSARELLHACQRIEHDHGRQRIERWGPRTLDVDIILYDGLIDSSDDLELPHPRAHERSFVLAPWAHVDPDAVLPGLGGGPVGALAATAPDRDGIRWLALDWLHESDEPSEARRAAPPSIAPQSTAAPAVPSHAAQQPAATQDLDRSVPTEAPAPRE